MKEIAWLGLVILCIVWFFLDQNHVVTQLAVPEIIRNVLTIILMAFIAAGISAVYTLEQLPYPFAALIQMAVLYFDYMFIYLLNGWMPVSALPVFSLIFVVGFGVIWLIIYLTIRRTAEKMNGKLNESK